MRPIKVLAFLLMAGGIAALAYGGFSYTKETHAAQIGSLELTVKDQRTVNIPVWAGVAAIVIGAGVLFIPFSKD
jgi:TRAP-type C4-dicarboxylate transport system permease small subunit